MIRRFSPAFAPASASRSRGFGCGFGIFLFVGMSFLLAPFFAAHAATMSKPPVGVSSGLVGWWTFDGKDMMNGVAQDKSGNGNNGNLFTIATSTFYAQGKIGQAGNFDGIDDYIDTGTSANPTSTFTLSTWVKFSAPAVGSMLLSKQTGAGGTADGFSLSTSVGGTVTVAFSVYQGDRTPVTISFPSSKTFFENKWHNIVAYNDGSFINLCVDTVCATPIAVVGFSPATSQHLMLGRKSYTAIGYVYGALDDTRIYNRALSTAEVTALYKQGSNTLNKSVAGPASGLVGYWTFDGKDMPNGVALDKSGQGNNGNTSGIATSTFYVQGKIGQGVSVINGERITMPHTNALNGITSMTASIWAKRSLVQAGARDIFSMCGSGSSNKFFEIRETSSSNIEFDAYNTTAGLGTGGALTSTDLNWHLLTGTWDGTTIRFYIDGVEKSNAAFSGVLNSSNVPSYVGAGSCNVGIYLGQVDDARIYNRALSATEVSNLYVQGGNTQNKSATGIASGLVGYWTFDGKDMPNGVAFDRSGNGNNGNLINIATSTFYKPGKIGQGANFDGVDDAVGLPSSSGASINVTGALTLSAWVKNNKLQTSFQPIITRGLQNSGLTEGQYMLGHLGSSQGDIGIKVFNGTAIFSAGSVAATRFPVGTWNHIVGTYDGVSTLKVYVNGVLVDTQTSPGFGTLNSANAVTKGIGIGDNPLSSSPFNGTLDDVRIYNRALSQSEITTLYNLGR